MFLTVLCLLSGRGTPKVTTVPKVDGAVKVTAMQIVTPASMIMEVCSGLYYFFTYLFFYLFTGDTENSRDTGRGRSRQREKQAPCRELDVGLNPRTPGSAMGRRQAPNH